MTPLTRILSARLAACALIALSTPGYAAEPPPAAPPAPAPAAPPSPSPAPPSGLASPAAGVPSAPPTLTTRLLDASGAETARGLLAEPLTLEVVLSGPEGATFYPPFRPALGAFELLPSPAPVQRVGGGQVSETWRFAILPVRTGVERVPAIEIPYRLPDGVEGALKTPVTRVDVAGHLANAQDPEPAPPPDAVPVVTTDWLLVWLLSGLGVLVVATLLALFIVTALGARFRALAPAPPPRPADAVALERLAALEADATLDGVARHAAVIDTLRAYLGQRYARDVMEMTTRETLAALSDVDLKGVDPQAIAGLLGEADLVKFAGYAYSNDESLARVPVVRELVARTWEPPAPPEEDDQPRLAQASPRQRMLAGGLDALLAGLLGAGLFVGLWLAGLPALGWLAFVAAGVALALRDVVGRSLGKRVLGLDLVTRGESQRCVPPARRLSRNALLILWPVVGPLELLLLRQHPLGARLGDLVADTEVVQGQRLAARGGAA
jgi:hypothetical protein